MSPLGPQQFVITDRAKAVMVILVVVLTVLYVETGGLLEVDVTKLVLALVLVAASFVVLWVAFSRLYKNHNEPPEFFGAGIFFVVALVLFAWPLFWDTPGVGVSQHEALLVLFGVVMVPLLWSLVFAPSASASSSGQQPVRSVHHADAS